jgi:hypothetical protein
MILRLFQVASVIFKVDTTNADEMATGERAKYLLTLTLTSSTDVSVDIKLPYDTTALFTVSGIEIENQGENLILQEPLPKPVFMAAENNAGNNRVLWSLGMISHTSSASTEPYPDDLVIRAVIQAQDHPNLAESSIHRLNFSAVCNETLQYVVQKPVTMRSGGTKFVKVDLRLNSTFQNTQDSLYIEG